MGERDAGMHKGFFGAARTPGPLGLHVATFPSTKEDAWAIPRSSSVASELTAEHPRELRGHFTIERRIEGLNLRGLETTIGYKDGLLTAGARIYVFTEQPQIGQFVFAGSSITPAAKDLVSPEERMKTSNVAPGAWLNERLVKVVPIQKPSNDPDNYPRAKSPAEQWVLLVPLPVKFLRDLHGDQRYYRHRGR